MLTQTRRNAIESTMSVNICYRCQLQVIHEDSFTDCDHLQNCTVLFI